MVNTFITSSDPIRCAEVLDNKRLNKQLLEIELILDILCSTVPNTNSRYKRHPAVLMWKGYEDALEDFYNICLSEWLDRGMNSSRKYIKLLTDDIIYPWWFSWELLHVTHKCSLLRKDPNYYERIFDNREDLIREGMKYGYIWPSKIYLKYSGRGDHYDILDHIFNTELRFLCDPLGKGVPPQYRYSKDVVERWLRNTNINPLTGRKLNSKKKGSIYDDFRRAAEFYGLCSATPR